MFTCEVSHSLHETFTICENCNIDGSLVRKPSKIFLTKKQDQLGQSFEAGAVVEEAIKDAKLELQDDQDSLKNRVYKK